MSEILLTHRYAFHSGGTKFYRAIHICSGKTSLVVRNYGTLSADMTPNVGTATIKLEPVSAYLKVISTKSGRGYRFDPESTIKLKSLDDLRDHIWSEFKFKDRIIAQIASELRVSAAPEETSFWERSSTPDMAPPPPVKEAPKSEEYGKAWGAFG